MRLTAGRGTEHGSRGHGGVRLSMSTASTVAIDLISIFYVNILSTIEHMDDEREHEHFA